MKAVAVPYIIALVLGVAVIGLVGYWFVASGGKFGGQSAITICENKFLQFCIGKGTDETHSSFTSQVRECQSVTSSHSKCSDILGSRVSPTSPSPTPTPSPTPPTTSVCSGGTQQCRGTNLDCSFCGAGKWVCRNDKCTPD